MVSFVLEVLDDDTARGVKNLEWFINTFIRESWLNPLRGLPFGRLWCIDSWFA